ncbi:MAG TPA: ornithine cyclodeaminase family protein [Solirubrobacterales bacterium]|nr:ornithine cyclodeaminase family protein [Solirubrobacterales bacterium]
MTAPQQYTDEEVALALSHLELGEVVLGAFVDHHLGRTVLPEEACLRWVAPDGGAARSIAMHAYIPGPPARMGMKVINSSVGNPDRGLPRASGLIALFDPETAAVTHLLPAAEISAARTATVSSLAVSHLSGPSPRRLAVIGAGPLGAMHARLIANALPIESLVVFDFDRHRAERLVDAAAPAGEIAASAEEAVRDADVVVTATTATEPYVRLEWISPGAVVVNVSLDDLLPEVFLGADALYVDDWSIVVSDSHRLLGRMARAGSVVSSAEPGGSGAQVLTGELGALFAGAAPGRTDPRQRIVVNPFGLAISDVAVAAAVVECESQKRDEREVGAIG